MEEKYDPMECKGRLDCIFVQNAPPYTTAANVHLMEPVLDNRLKKINNITVDIYMLFAGWEVRMVKNCDRGLENATRGRRPRAAFSGPRSQFFTIRTDPKPANNMFIFFLH